jgi:tetratricopeptide (TPR) repeat protein
VFIFLCVLVLATASASAQGRVTGVVKDTEGRPLKGATIVAENPNYSATAITTVTSDAKGRYSFLGLRGGVWTFTANAPGFQPSRRRATTRTTGNNPAVDFELEVLKDGTPSGPLANVDARAIQQQLATAADLERTGRLDEAIASYREILARVPALTSVHVQLGMLFEGKGDTTAAVAEYQAAIKADPANAKARAALDRLARH